MWGGSSASTPHILIFRQVKKGLSEKSKIAILVPANEPDSGKNMNKLPTSRQIYSVRLGQLPTDLPFGTAPSSKEKAIMGAVAPKPPLSTHPHSELLGFLAFSYDSSFSTLSPSLLTNTPGHATLPPSSNKFTMIRVLEACLPVKECSRYFSETSPFISASTSANDFTFSTPAITTLAY